MIRFVAVAAGVAQVGICDQIFVPDDQPTIQAGIDVAQKGDEVIVAPGTYAERIRFKGKRIEVRSSDGPQVATIDLPTCNISNVVELN